ncbi:glycerate kinase [Metallococcus carri]|uniref:glycerate kinase n=1 Tax=Metallococcus carri TaxID=1656884 RepID=UPI002E293B02|nr:glycerate kinase [Metallococcus carri]
MLLAPDKFKGTLTAVEVAAAVSAGIASVDASVRLVTVPVADGGDGTVAAAVAAGFEQVTTEVTGPVGAPVTATWARRGDEAVVELAEASGIALLGDALDPMGATSRGTGELIAAALDAGCRRIVVGIGGSACTDGGLGLVQALGAKALSDNGSDASFGGAALRSVATLDLADLHPGLARAEIIVASDVDNPLLGERGAAAVYGPQKGASADQVRELDSGLAHWADVVAGATGADHRDDAGAGAAGGAGFGLIAVLGASTAPGAPMLFELTGFAAALAEADLVVTGEGKLDRQTLHGKAPAAVAAAARDAEVPVIAVCGTVDLPEREWRAAGIRDVYALLDQTTDPDEAMTRPAPLLRRIGAAIARDHLSQKGIR